MNDPKIISLDIETYGKTIKFMDGRPCPDQRLFNPQRSMHQDGVARNDLVQTVAITLPRSDPRIDGQWSPEAFTQLEPGESMVAEMRYPSHRKMLYRWLMHADVIMGWNIQFDIMYLRAFSTAFRQALDGIRHTLIDGIVVNYLSSEMRPEGSLKAVGRVLQTHTYEDLKNDDGSYKRYENQAHPDLHFYNCEDTHNVLLDIPVLAQRIIDDYPNTDKLSPFCIQHYSQVLWTVIRMAEAGIPMDRTTLLRLERTLTLKSDICAHVAFHKYGLVLDTRYGKPDLSKRAFIEQCIDTIRTETGINLADHLLMEFTDGGDISFSDVNRRLIKHHIPTNHPLVAQFKLFDIHSSALKMITSFIFPLLYHKRARKKGQLNKSDIILPLVVPKPKPVITNDLPPVKRIHRTRTLKQWKVRHTTRKQCRGSWQDRKRVLRARSKYRCKRVSHVTYTPKDVIKPRQSLVIDYPPQCEVAYPTWFPVPSQQKGSGADGGTVQARITPKNPAAQTWPEAIKKCMYSRFSGGLIVAYDLDQIELKDAGVLSGEPSILAAYPMEGEGVDLHTQRAIDVFTKEFLIEKCGEPLHKGNPTFSDLFRQPAKHFNFSDLFQAGWKKMLWTLLKKGDMLMDPGICQHVVEQRQALRPKLADWQSRMVALAQKQGYVEMPFIGQSRLFMGGEEYEVNEIVNMPVQAFAGNTLLRLQAYIHECGPSINDPLPPFLMFNNIFDAILFDVRDREGLKECDELMASAVEYVAKSGYWYRMCELTGNHVPLTFTRTVYGDFEDGEETAEHREKGEPVGVPAGQEA